MAQAQRIPNIKSPLNMLLIYQLINTAQDSHNLNLPELRMKILIMPHPFSI